MSGAAARTGKDKEKYKKKRGVQEYRGLYKKEYKCLL